MTLPTVRYSRHSTGHSHDDLIETDEIRVKYIRGFIETRYGYVRVGSRVESGGKGLTILRFCWCGWTHKKIIMQGFSKKALASLCGKWAKKIVETGSGE